MCDILYYETLDIPLPELEGLKTLRVAFQNATNYEVSFYILCSCLYFPNHIIRQFSCQVSFHIMRSPKSNTLFDLIEELKSKVCSLQ